MHAHVEEEKCFLHDKDSFGSRWNVFPDKDGFVVAEKCCLENNSFVVCGQYYPG